MNIYYILIKSLIPDKVYKVPRDITTQLLMHMYD